MHTERIDQRPPTTWDLLRFGCLVRRAKDLHRDTFISVAVENLQSIIEEISWLEFQDTYELARRTLAPVILRLMFLDPTGNLPLGGEFERVASAIQPVLDELQSEAARRTAFLVTPSKYVDVQALLNEPSLLFGLPAFLDPPLPSEVDRLIREAGRCLAANFGWAASLFTLQATEHITRYYYEIVRKEPPKDTATFGNLVQALTPTRFNCPKLVLQYLNYVVDQYRNAAMHGRLECNSAIAIDIWTTCSSATKEMLSDLASRRAKQHGKAQPALTPSQ